MIITVCYSKFFEFATREEAIEFYTNAIKNSEGSEKRRYENICDKLKLGLSFATDTM